MASHMDTVSATPRTTQVKNTSTWMELLMARPTFGAPSVSLNATLQAHQRGHRGTARGHDGARV